MTVSPSIKHISCYSYTDKDCTTPGAPGGEVCLTAVLLKFIYDVTRLISGIKVCNNNNNNNEYVFCMSKDHCTALC